MMEYTTHKSVKKFPVSAILLSLLLLMTMMARAQDTSLESDHFAPIRWYASNNTSSSHHASYSKIYGKTISLSFYGMKLEEVLKTIAQKGHLRLSYDKKQLANHTITFVRDNLTVIEAFEGVLKGTGLEVLASPNGQVVIKQSKNPEAPVVQAETVSGTVTDASTGETLPGVNIRVKGTTTGTATDANGQYELSVESLQDTLVFSFVGYATKNVPINGRTAINISLSAQAISGEEMVVVGYGTQRKSDLTGSVSSIFSEKLQKNSESNLSQKLQASVPGLTIQRSSGEPATSANIRIRGLNSISANNSPLIVYDGIPFQGNLRDINPDDIASVEVLKDASAAAIYGSRAANGVILITTKEGTKGKTVVKFNTSLSVKNEAVEHVLMGPKQFYNFRKQAYLDDGLLEGVSKNDIPQTILQKNEYKSYKRGESINWMDQMLDENALTQDYNASIGAGNKNLSNYFSLSYLDDNGLQKTTGSNRITLKDNLSFTVNDWIEISDRFTFSLEDYKRRYRGKGRQSAFYRLSPYARIYNDDGSFTKFPQANDNLFINPVAENELTSQKNRSKKLFNTLNIMLTPSFINGLSYNMKFGSTLNNSAHGFYAPQGTYQGDALNGSASVNNADLLDITWENLVKYDKTLADKHTFKITGLFSLEHHENNFNSAEASDFVSDDYLWHNLSGGALQGIPNSSYSKWNLISYMLRFNYNFNDRYLLTLTGRKDGYSGFGTGNKYGFFPSAAVAWRISEEKFMEDISWLDNLKLRASYGSVGNQAVGTYQSLAKLSSAKNYFGEEPTSGLLLSSLANPSLSWETTKTLDVGTDFSFLDGRLSGIVEYYHSKTNGLLLRRAISEVTGQHSILSNIGNTMNKGLEISLDILPVQRKDFSWDLNLNFSTNHNEIISLYGDKEDDIANNWFVGEPLGIYYDYEFGGIWQSGQEDKIADSATPDRKPGDAMIIDQNKDGVLDDEDKKIVGDRLPKWTGGLSSTFTYKNLSLYVFVQTVQGRDMRLQPQGLTGRTNNFMFDYWTPQNPTNNWVKPSLETPKFYGSMNIYDDSFWRIKDIRLSYNIPKNLIVKVGLNKLSVYANLHDYFTFSDFPFVDPESATPYSMSIPKYAKIGLKVSL